MQTVEFTQWLLDASTPSIRYLTLRQLQGRNEAAPEMRAAWREMKNVGPIPAILEKQSRIGAWSGEQSYYTPKYTSTHWSLLLLAELAAECKSSGMRRGAIYMLGETYEELMKRLEEGAHGLTCFWGNLLRYTLYCELDDDPRLRDILGTLRYDAGPAEWRCRHNDDRPCAWGAARALWGLALLPEHLRAWPEVEQIIASGLRFLLEEHQLVEANYPVPAGGKIHSMWFSLNFPLFYQADILFVLRVLAELGALDHPGAQPALKWLRDKRFASGRWRGTSPYRGRTYQELGDREETDRWVTLHAAHVLNRAG
jgi:hypothetical protein